MEQEKTLRLVLRQLRDIQAQAAKISEGENSSENLESFARYSSELREYITRHVESPQVKAYLIELPNVNYTRTQVKLWQYFFLPSLWLDLYKDHQAKNETMREIAQVRGKYATLEILIKEII